MNKYQLLINGKNFLVELDGKAQKAGFFRYCFVEAETPENAEQEAVQSLRRHKDLLELVRNQKTDPPILEVVEYYELEEFEEYESETTGLIWYREKKWWQFWK